VEVARGLTWKRKVVGAVESDGPLEGLRRLIDGGVAGRCRAVRLRDRSSMTYLQRPSSSAPLPLQGGPQEPDELTRFRNDWRHEVQLHRADATHESSADPVPPAHGPPAAQHYSAEELPKAQDSFVSLQHINLLFPRRRRCVDVHSGLAFRPAHFRGHPRSGCRPKERYIRGCSRFSTNPHIRP
jgi:hypothetical protein